MRSTNNSNSTGVSINIVTPDATASRTPPRLQKEVRIHLERGKVVLDEEPSPPPPPLDKCGEDGVKGRRRRAPPTPKKNDKDTPPINTKKLVQEIFAIPKKEKPKKRKGSSKSKKKGGKKVKTTEEAEQEHGVPDGEEGDGEGEVADSDLSKTEEDGGEKEEETLGDDKASSQNEREEVGAEEEVPVEEEMGEESDSSKMGFRRKLRSRVKEEQNGHEGEEGTKKGKGKDKERGEDSESNSNSKKSDEDEDSLSNCGNLYKPLRRAMLNAMELVAKKQVTDDMRIDRRVRKQVTKSAPPKGRGRRNAVFKRGNKPIKSCEFAAGPIVGEKAYHNNCFYQRGDIVCLLDDLRGGRTPSLTKIRLFQITGFLKVPLKEDCVGLKPLMRTVPPPVPRPIVFGRNGPVRKPPPENPDDDPEEKAYKFNTRDYTIARAPELLVSITKIKFVMHCPEDFFFGHDLFYDELFPGRSYTRIGNDLYKYEEETVLRKDRVENDEASSSSNSDDESNIGENNDSESIHSSSNTNNGSNTSSSDRLVEKSVQPQPSTMT